MNQVAAPIRARIDPAERIISADEPLAGLQLRCGGQIPGIIAIPTLLTLVRKARRQRLRLARKITAHDDGQVISAWAEVDPGDNGTELALTHWHAEPAAGSIGPSADGSRSEFELVRHIAECHALLDTAQIVRYVSAQAADLKQFERKAKAAPDTPWTSLVDFEGLEAQQTALHWRLLDGARLTVPGSERRWLARLAPLTAGGFELFLVPAAIESLPQDMPVSRPADCDARGNEVYHSLLARELGPALRQPIDRIIANAETIRTRLGGPLADEYASYAADIVEAARHLLELVNDLSDLDAIESPNFAPAADAIDLNDCAARAAGLLSVRARRREIAIVTPARDYSVPAIGEFRRVLQVLLNLIGNAINYAPEGTRIVLDCGSVGERAWISVDDQGQGLTPDQVTMVFEKFERLGRSNDGGSGLGLYISRRLARAMGGDLTVSATPGQGASFVLTLPAGQASSPSGTAAEP
jgi:signal transduction histidine kinase